MTGSRAPGPPGAGSPSASATWRRSIHVLSGGVGPLATHLPPTVAALVFGGLVAVAGGAETARLASPGVQAWFDRLVGPLFRPAERAGISGATTLVLGYALAWWLFPVGAAERAILVTALADPMAAMVGTRFGAGPGKTWAGSAACAVTAALVLLLTQIPLPVAAAAGAGAAVAERVAWKGADNIAIPVVVAAVLRLLA